MSVSQPIPEHESFRIDVHPQRAVVRVAPAGELDIATAGRLAGELQELRDVGFDRVVLDLRRLTFMDSTGVALLLSEDRCARENGHDFMLIAGAPPIQRVMEICGIARLMRYQSSHADAQPAPAASAPQTTECAVML